MLLANARVGAKPRAYLVDVGAGGLRDVGNHVDERDLHRQKRVGGMLDYLLALVTMQTRRPLLDRGDGMASSFW